MYTVGGRWKHGGEAWTDWCGGFLAGMMWLFHRQTRDSVWRARAEHYSRLLEYRKNDRHVHDLGFIFLNTFARWYELTGDRSRMDVVAVAGQTLAGRFQEKGQYLASFLGPDSLFVDIMMNVPLLFVAAAWLEKGGDQRGGTRRAECGVPEAESGATCADRETSAISSGPQPSALRPPPSVLRRIAMAHCLTSQKYLVRPDGSTVHEAIFDIRTGEFLRESTQQGLRADSCWSRGTAWALYGFGTAYKHTGDSQCLETAIRCADYFTTHLPLGRIPYWDFDLPESPNPIWDSSAAAIAASGLLQLAELIESSKESSSASLAQYREAALSILDALCTDTFLASSTPGWEGILKHAVYHYHKQLGVDESVMWGDHFFVEALVRALALTPDSTKLSS